MDPDEEIVARQIGRRPRGMLRVESRCAWGYPVAVSVAPVVPRRGPTGAGEEPFPTHFWLTCPILVEQIARLESGGLVGRLEEEAARDPALGARLREDHARHAAERFAALSPAGQEKAERDGTARVHRDSGVGGVRDLARIKCLHAHYAFHRARGGVVGKILDERYAPKECAPDDVRCDRYGIEPKSSRARYTLLSQYSYQVGEVAKVALCEREPESPADGRRM